MGLNIWKLISGFPRLKCVQVAVKSKKRCVYPKGYIPVIVDMK
ncbi:hypothetical protein IKG_05755 [Bacillus cereus VD200]|nr:hypothetical protein IKG_05755 [Bacillus cereus VD200]